MFMPSLFSYLKEISMASKLPLFQRLFEDPMASSIGDSSVIKRLEDEVNKNSNYKLPPGFIKYKRIEVREQYRAPTHVKKQAERIALELLDDIFNKSVGIHILDPIADNKKVLGVKADIF